MLTLVVKGKALRRALALVVAAALADGVHVAPVRLGLRVLQRIAIHLRPCARAAISRGTELILSLVRACVETPGWVLLQRRRLLRGVPPAVAGQHLLLSSNGHGLADICS